MEFHERGKVDLQCAKAAGDLTAMVYLRMRPLHSLLSVVYCRFGCMRVFFWCRVTPKTRAMLVECRCWDVQAAARTEAMSRASSLQAQLCNSKNAAAHSLREMEKSRADAVEKSATSHQLSLTLLRMQHERREMQRSLAGVAGEARELLNQQQMITREIISDTIQGLVGETNGLLVGVCCECGCGSGSCAPHVRRCTILLVCWRVRMRADGG